MKMRRCELVFLHVKFHNNNTVTDGPLRVCNLTQSYIRCDRSMAALNKRFKVVLGHVVGRFPSCGQEVSHRAAPLPAYVTCKWESKMASVAESVRHLSV